MRNVTSKVLILLASAAQSQATSQQPCLQRVREVALDAVGGRRLQDKLGDRSLSATPGTLPRHGADLDSSMLGKKGIRMYERVYIPECGTIYDDCIHTGCMTKKVGFEIVNETVRETLQNEILEDEYEELRNFEAYVLGPEGLFDQWLERLGKERERLVRIKGRTMHRSDVVDHHLKQIKAYSQKAIGQLMMNETGPVNEMDKLGGGPSDRLRRLELLERLIERMLDSQREIEIPTLPPSSGKGKRRERAEYNIDTTYAGGPINVKFSAGVTSGLLARRSVGLRSIPAVALAGLLFLFLLSTGSGALAAGTPGAGFAVFHFRRPGATLVGKEEPLLLPV